MTLLAQSMLFVTSYMPIFPIVIAIYWGQWSIVSLLAGVWAVAGVVSWLVFRVFASSAATSSYHSEVELRDDVPLSYLVTYLFPFVTADGGTPNQLAALAMMFILIGVLYVRTDLTYVNPTLALFRYSIYSARDETGKKVMLLAKTDSLPREGTLKAVPFGRNSRLIKL